MKTRQKQKVIIGTLIAVILGMCVGYAALSQILTITGTSGISGDFNIEFTKIEENTMVNAKTITKDGIGSTTANFTVDLEKPGSSALYDLTVENKGSIDAVLTSITGLDESNQNEPVDIIYTVAGIEEGDTLNSGEQKKFQVKVVWNVSATSVPTTSKSLTLKLNYEQNAGSSIVTTPEESFEMDEAGTVTTYTGTDTDVVIPSTIHGVPVTKIGDSSFRGKGLTSVVIPDSVTEIDSSAFASNNLTSVELPKNLTTINYGILQSNQLTSIKIPDGVTTIDGFAFQNNQLTSVVIPDSVKTIRDNAFSQNQLTSVTIGASVEEISSYAFEISHYEGMTSNPNLTKIINKSGRPFNWYEITRQGNYQSAVTGTFGQVIVTAE